jgi:hypothetical protein
MKYFRRLHDTATLIICSLVPEAAKTLCGGIKGVILSEHEKPEINSQESIKIPSYLSDLGYAANQGGTKSLFYPHGMPAAAPFILFRLKRCGFSGCRVTVTKGGLLVTASR